MISVYRALAVASPTRLAVLSSVLTSCVLVAGERPRLASFRSSWRCLLLLD